MLECNIFTQDPNLACKWDFKLKFISANGDISFYTARYFFRDSGFPESRKK